jgi:hypothetical protein
MDESRLGSEKFHKEAAPARILRVARFRLLLAPCFRMLGMAMAGMS